MPLSYTFCDTDNTLTIKLHGDLTLGVFREFHQACHTPLLPGAKVVVDLEESNYLDLAGAGMLLSLVDRLGNQVAQFSLRNCSGAVANTVKMAQLDAKYDVAAA